MNLENSRLQTIFDYKDTSLNDELEAIINCEGYQNIKFYINCYVGDPSICDVCDPYETISYTIECSQDKENWARETLFEAYYKADTTMHPGDNRHLYRTIDGWIQYEKMMSRFLRIKFFKRNNQHINNNVLKVSVEMSNTKFVTKDFCDSSFIKFYNRALTQEEIVEAVENREDQLLLQRLDRWALKEKEYRDNQQAYAQFANLPQNEIIQNKANGHNSLNLDLTIRKCNPQENIVSTEYPKTTILDEKDRDIGFCVAPLTGSAHDDFITITDEQIKNYKGNCLTEYGKKLFDAPQKDWRDAWYDRYDDE